MQGIHKAVARGCAQHHSVLFLKGKQGFIIPEKRCGGAMKN